MKFTYRFSIIACLSLILASCSTDYADNDFSSDTNSGWLEFGSEETTATDTDSEILIPVIQESATNTNGTTEITYTIQNVEGNEAPQDLLGTYTSTVIAENELSGFLSIPVSDTDSSYSVLITIVDSNKDNLIIGLEGDHPITHTVTVCDGTFSESYNGSAFRNGNLVNNFETTITQIEDTNQYDITTAWGPSFVAILTGDPSFEDQFVYSGVITINSDNTIVIDADDSVNFPDGGTGTYDPCLKSFSYTLTQGVFTDPFTVNVELVSND